MRASGVHEILIYCRDHRCSHHIETNADGWPDDVRLSDIEPNFTCTKCGKRGRRDQAGVCAGRCHGASLGARQPIPNCHPHLTPISCNAAQHEGTNGE
jgi:hypothetical protein